MPLGQVVQGKDLPFSGGSFIIKKKGGLSQKNITYVEDICANAKGYEMLGNAYLKAVLQRQAG